jgi:hypothetical protein
MSPALRPHRDPMQRDRRQAAYSAYRARWAAEFGLWIAQPAAARTEDRPPSRPEGA